MSAPATATAVVKEALDRQDVQIELKDVGHATARVMQGLESSKAVAVVPVQSATASKINWTQLAALVAGLASYFGLDLSGETVAAVIMGILAASNVITAVLKTFFNNSVTPQSAGKA